MNNFNFKSYDTSKQSISYCEVDKCPAVIKLKAENEKIEQCIIEQNRLVVGMTKEIETLTFKKYELLQTLTEIKEIAENGKRFAERWMITGEQKANVLTYANAILQKISECEVENESN